MKIIILSPIIDLLFDIDTLHELKAYWEVIIIKDIAPLEEIKELYTEEPKILAIDPDFCWWSFPKEVIMNLKNTNAICLQTTSFSRIDTNEARKQNIPVLNLRWFSTEAVAEWATMMALNVARKIPLVIKDGWNQDFNKHQWVELKGKDVWIIWLWAIWKRIAEICSALGTNISYWSKNSKDDRYQYRELQDLITNSDFIFLAVAQNDQTIWLITDDMLKSIKKEGVFVSIVHKIYNHKLLLDLAKSNSIYGYAFESWKEKITDFEWNIRAWPELWRCTEESLIRNADQRKNAIINSAKWSYINQIN